MLKKVQELLAKGQAHEAERHLNQLLREKPQAPQVLESFVTFHLTVSLNREAAFNGAKQLIQLRPNSAEANYLAAETLSRINRRPAARQHIERALELAPDNAKVLTTAAGIYLEDNDFEKALAAVERAEELAPGGFGTKIQRGRILYSMGRLEETVALCEELLAEAPYSTSALALYFQAQTMTAEDPHYLRLRDEILPHQEKHRDVKLRDTLRTLGKISNEVGEYDAAFNFYKRSKELKPLAYKADAYADFVTRVRRDISRADFFGRGVDSERPVLIVGMPRSGSTLLEQVLAGHPEIGSVGESRALRGIHNDMKFSVLRGEQMVKAIKTMPADVGRKLAERYLRETDRPGHSRVVDKALHNFELLGLFAAAMPKARIINIMRDPMDNCTSMYMQALNDSHVYTQSLVSLGHSFVQYRRLMEHWKKVLPNPILEVRYEDTVADLEHEARRVIDFLGLEWTDKCLDFRNAENQVRTISARQVRQPIYRSSMQRWKRYERHLGPLKQSLAQFYPDGFDAPAVQ